jgi:hypothetical protein
MIAYAYIYFFKIRKLCYKNIGFQCCPNLVQTLSCLFFILRFADCLFFTMKFADCLFFILKFADCLFFTLKFSETIEASMFL